MHAKEAKCCGMWDTNVFRFSGRIESFDTGGSIGRPSQ